LGDAVPRRVPAGLAESSSSDLLLMELQIGLQSKKTLSLFVFLTIVKKVNISKVAIIHNNNRDLSINTKKVVGNDYSFCTRRKSWILVITL